MAAPPKATHPGRLLVVFVLVLVALGGLMFLVSDTRTPQLGLDLQGGTSITLTARQTAGGDVTSEALQTAANIIRSRVDGAGVAESEVTTQGSTTIIVSVPAVGVDELIKLVGTTAELRFRQVLNIAAPGPQVPPTEPPTTTGPSASPTGPSTTAPTTSSATSSPPATITSGPTSAPLSLGGRGSSVQNGLSDLAAAVTSSTATGTTPATSTPAATTPASTTPTEEPSEEPTEQPSAPPDEIDLASAQAKFATLECSAEDLEGGNSDDPDKALATCDKEGTSKYLLSNATVLGTDVTDAFAGLPQQGFGEWQVNLRFNGNGTRAFSTMTAELVSAPPPTNQFAIVLDGIVVSAPQVLAQIPNGQAQITGNFTQAEATDLANTLKYGALPLAFETSDVSEVTPTLGSESLRAGLIAGMIGLALVFVYAMFYYRALGVVVIGSLVIAGAVTYIAVVLLSSWIRFTLTLAGVAGLIVAIGVTADSFIIYFERIRDEVREGRTLRAAIEHGWLRARRTIITADVVSLLSSVVLYIVSIGSVRGFAFALGLSTVIDLVIVFLFTKPLMSWLGGKRFFGEGSRWSGLSGDRLARPARATSTTKGARSARTAAEEA